LQQTILEVMTDKGRAASAKTKKSKHRRSAPSLPELLKKISRKVRAYSCSGRFPDFRQQTTRGSSFECMHNRIPFTAAFPEDLSSGNVAVSIPVTVAGTATAFHCLPSAEPMNCMFPSIPPGLKSAIHRKVNDVTNTRPA